MNVMSYSKKEGMGKKEAFHSSINCSTDDMSHISAEALDVELLAWIHRHNYRIDYKYGGTRKESTGRV